MRSLLLAVCLLVTGSLRAQTDSVVALSVRCGKYIDARERAYFGFFNALPDSEVVFVTRSSDGIYTIRFLKGTRSPFEFDPISLKQSVDLFDFYEALRASRQNIEEVLEQREGDNVRFGLVSGGRAEGELLFADVHGVVILDTGVRVIPASDILVTGGTSKFGEGILWGARLGVAVSAAVFGLTGAAGGDIDADLGLFGSAFISGAGVVVGLLYDLIALGASSASYDAAQGWSPEYIRALQQDARFPLGNPELKRLLGESGNREEIP